MPCPHGRRRNQCKECGGKGICTHGRVRSVCKDCGGGGICTHGRVRSVCKECGGKGLCPHGRVRSRCKDCGGGSICTHGRRRSRCKECKGECGQGGRKRKAAVALVQPQKSSVPPGAVSRQLWPAGSDIMYLLAPIACLADAASSRRKPGPSRSIPASLAALPASIPTGGSAVGAGGALEVAVGPAAGSTGVAGIVPGVAVGRVDTRSAARMGAVPISENDVPTTGSAACAGIVMPPPAAWNPPAAPQAAARVPGESARPTGRAAAARE